MLKPDFQFEYKETPWLLYRKRTIPTATGRRILVPTFVDRGVSRSQRGGTTKAVNLSFLDQSRYFSFQVAPHLCSQG
jgi:hypothetical protein